MVEMPKQNVPALRLDGFSGEWSSASLQELASLFTDGDWIESKDQSTEGIRLLQTGNVGIGTFVQKSATQKWISEETFKRLRCQEVLSGDILISRLPDPAGRACIVPMMPYRMITAVDCTIVRLSEENDADYLVAYLGNPSYFEHIDTLLAGGTRQRVSRSQLAVIEAPVPPTLEEQQTIGAIFTNLDAAINQHTLKHKSLQQTKTALMQRMFPQEGQTVPELRLEGFSGEWETTSIGAVSALHNGRDYKHLGEGCIPVYGTGGYMASVDQALSHDKDAVGIGRKGTINKPYILRAPFWTVDTLFYVVPNQDTDLAFFYASVLQVDWMAKNTATGLPSLTSQAINSADISVPPTLEEQQAIGAIFTKLDQLIAAEAQYIESFKQAKTALLQRMFI